MALCKATYLKRKAEGLCTQCGKPIVVPLGTIHTSTIRCLDCTQKNTDNRAAKRQRARDNGKCTECPNNAKPGKALCEACIAKRSAKSTERYYQFKETGTCRMCGVETDGGSRCPKHKQQLKEWRQKRRTRQRKV